MNNLIFPEGVTYKYRYITGGDVAATDIKLSTFGNLYKYCSNNVIDFKFNTSNIISTNYLFNGCSSLISVSLFDTSNVTNMSNMFYGCSKLTSVPQFDTSNVTDMSSMFYNCSVLTSIPSLDTYNVTNMSNMFYGCSKLTSVPQFDTSNVTNMSAMFQSCNYLTSIPQLDCSKVTNIGLFGYNGSTYIINLGGFKNLGMQKSLYNTTGSYFLGASSKLTHESIMNVINNLYDRASAGYSVLTLKLHANTLALLSDEEKAIATNKGWTLS